MVSLDLLSYHLEDGNDGDQRKNGLKVRTYFFIFSASPAVARAVVFPVPTRCTYVHVVSLQVSPARGAMLRQSMDRRVEKALVAGS